MAKSYAELSPAQKAARAAYYREYHKRPHRIAKTRARAVAAQRKRRARIAALIRSAKDRPCVDCGVRLPPECMDFDHVRGVKRIDIGHATRAKGYLSWAEMQVEIAKCDVRCPNCHRMRHYRERAKA